MKAIYCTHHSYTAYELTKEESDKVEKLYHEKYENSCVEGYGRRIAFNELIVNGEIEKPKLYKLDRISEEWDDEEEVLVTVYP